MKVHGRELDTGGGGVGGGGSVGSWTHATSTKVWACSLLAFRYRGRIVLTMKMMGRKEDERMSGCRNVWMLS